MSKSSKRFRFQGLVMEVSLVVFNVFLVLTLIYAWTHFFAHQTNNEDAPNTYRYVKASSDSTLVE
ncbi:MAG: hypothetical protein JXQ87_01060 [Bacteroidia bacterium]